MNPSDLAWNRRLDAALPGLFVPRRPPVIVGHRGAAGLAPENTLEAIEAGVRNGAEMVEVDVQATSDGKLVLLHDVTLDRTTDTRGDVRSLAWASVALADAGWAWSADGGPTRPWRRRGVRIPLLAEALEAFPSTLFALELKPTLPPASVRPLARLLLPQASRVVVGSESHALIDAFRTVAPGVPTGLSEREVRTFYALSRIGLSRLFRAPGRAFQVPPTSGGDQRGSDGRRTGVRVLTPGFVRAAHAGGRAVVAWTVNDPREMKELLAMGVDGLTTDRPDLARDVLAEAGHTGNAR